MRETVRVEKSSGGIGFAGALFIVFLVLKLTHVISWPWVWVFAPLWIPIALFGISVLIVMVLAIFLKDL